MTDFKGTRERRQQRQTAERRRSRIIWGLVVLAVGGLVAYLAWVAVRPAQGLAVPTADASHISEGTEPTVYAGNPPSSGQHYSTPLPRGFYEEADLEEWGPYPFGHAIHSLEHGYIIFWYNCDVLSNAECEELKGQLRDYVEGPLAGKLIAFPWNEMDLPLMLTSWGYMLEMPEFNAREARSFISANRLLAPEPNAP